MVKVVEVVELMTMGGGLVPTCTVCEVYSTVRKYMLVLLDSGVSEQKPCHFLCSFPRAHACAACGLRARLDAGFCGNKNHHLTNDIHVARRHVELLVA